MSFLTERTLRAAVPMCRRTLIQAPRAFSTSFAMRKTPTESVKDGLKTVDRTVTDNVVLPGLEAAASAGSKIKEGAETVTHGTKGTASEVRGKAEGKAEELKGKAKGAAAEAEGKAKRVAEDVKSQL